MKSLTAVLIILASFPLYSCPFHDLYFIGDGDSTPYPRSFIGNKGGEKPKFVTERKPQGSIQFNNYNFQLKRWQENKRKQQEQPSSDTSQAPLVENSSPKENLEQ